MTRNRGRRGANANASKNSLCAVNVCWAKRKRKEEGKGNREERSGEEKRGALVMD